MVTLGVTVTEEPVKFPGFQVKVPPGTFAVAVRVAVCPEQMVVPEVVIVGAGLTVMVIGIGTEEHPPPPFNGVIITCPFVPGEAPVPKELETAVAAGITKFAPPPPPPPPPWPQFIPTLPPPPPA